MLYHHKTKQENTLRFTRLIKPVAVVILLFVAIALSAYILSRSRSFQLFGELVQRGQTTEKVVALTFDDGPTPHAVEQLLSVLKAHDTKATFFVLGRDLEKHPETGRQIVEAGHELGNHSYSHQRMIFKTSYFIEQEIERTDQLIRATGYQGLIHFRPPYGKKLFMLPRYLQRTKRKTIMWDIEPESYTEIVNHTEKIVAHVRTHVQSGSIILLHPMYPSGLASLDAVPKIIEQLRSEGYRFVTISELLDMSR